MRDLQGRRVGALSVYRLKASGGNHETPVGMWVYAQDPTARSDLCYEYNHEHRTWMDGQPLPKDSYGPHRHVD